MVNNYKQVTKEDIDAFLAGSDPMEHIIKIECGYDENKVSIIYRNEEGKKRIKRDYFKPFVWCNERTAKSLFGGDRATLKVNMERYNLGCKKLRTERNDGTIPERMEHGYKFMFYAKGAMTYNEFMKFFDNGGIPIYKDKDDGTKPYIAVSPVEQYMIQTGKRMFKGYDNYDDLVRLEWDLETEGLDPHKDAISQIGIRTNKGYEKIITVAGEGNEKLKNEFNAIIEFFNIIKEIQPDVITGHNTENFDWNFINVRLQLRNLDLKNVTNGLFPRGIYKKKKQQVLKLGGEMEYYYPTIMWGYNITDSLFAVRRAQAIDSNMKSATLKYVTKYSGIAKKNRVYVPGKIINKTWEDENYDYAFNDDNGNWFKISDRIDKITIDNLDNIIDNKTGENFERVTGRYIVQRYLLDDLWETDKVELRYNESNYLVGKMLPVSFEKVCTMGTAAIWKYIMLAWSYEHNLAIPRLIQRKPFTGGLSRLLRVGYAPKIVKLDYNSLYPSIILTYGIRSDIDVMDVMSALLNYILTQREYYKGLKGKYGKEADALKEKLSTLSDTVEIEATKNAIAKAKQLKSRNDKMQLPLKIVGNGFFGSYGSGSVFPHSDIVCAEETTCTGRQMLRLMISHFTNIGYTPIVGDSFTGDTPLFIKYNDTNLIDIKPIKELIDERQIQIDGLGREYDYSTKPYKVLCRSGWIEPEYIYRHKTNKPIYTVKDGDMLVEVTEDHSLFNSKQEKIKPSEINESTKLEYYNNVPISNVISLSEKTIIRFIKCYNNGILKELPQTLLNATQDNKKEFLNGINLDNLHEKNKTIRAGIQFLKRSI